jgi:hypothetical protein
MLERRFATGQPQADLAQRIHVRHLAKQHGHELFPAGETFAVALGLMALDGLGELPSRKQLQYLRKHTAYLSHG